MTTIATLEVNKFNLAETRRTTSLAPPLTDGSVLVKIDRFAITANNVTYGVVGEKIGYWNFFPAADGWGVIPVWGFADVLETAHAEVKVGERLYGYFPMGTHLVLSPRKLSAGRLVDAAAHRAMLPPVYNSYARVNAEPGYNSELDNARALLFPLYATSYCLYDFLIDKQWFGAQQVVIVSASSKTAIGLGIALAGDDAAPPSVALTSTKNEGMVKALGYFDRVETYQSIAAIEASIPTVIIDMSGNGAVLSVLHAHLGDNMRYCSNVGVTHYEENTMGPGFIRERSAMFFAPGHIQKRAKEWGPGVFDRKAFAFWKVAAVESQRWLTYEHIDGFDAMASAFHRVRRGTAAPDRGLVVAL